MSFSLFVGVGCGGGAGSGGPISLADFPAAEADVLCARAAFCGQYPDKASCLSANILDFGQVMADVAAGKATYDGAAAATCLAAVRKDQTIACTVSAEASHLSDPSCSAIFTGTVADGGSCTSGQQCASGSCDVSACTGAATCCAGTCDATVANPVPLGGDCTAPAARCAAGTFCRGVDTANGKAGTCGAVTPEGGACATGEACASGLLCVPAGPNTLDAVCGTAPAEGQSCNGGVPCDAHADYCDPVTSLCTPRIAVGGACPSSAGCVSYATCDPTTMVCVALGGLGEACQVNCLGTLACSGTCMPRTPADTCP
jgi:hypothetical protein